MQRRADRKTGKYRVQVKLAGKLIGDKCFSSRTLADEYRATVVLRRERIRAGLETLAESRPLRDVANDWLKKISSEKVSHDADRLNLEKYVLPQVGAKSIQQCTKLDLESALEKAVAKAKLSNAKYNRIRATLHTLFVYAVKRELVKSNPVSLIDRRSERIKTKTHGAWETDEEIKAYLEAAQSEGPVFDLFARLALGTGLRVGEVSALRLSDVEAGKNGRPGTLRVHAIFDKAQGQVVERTKAGDGIERYVPICPDLERRISARLYRSPDEFLLQRADGQPFHPERIYDAHVRVCKKAGLKHITVHGLRATFARWYRRHGGNKDDLRILLGHASQVVTQVYAPDSKDNVKAMLVSV